MAKKLADIQKQVEEKQAELERQRQNNKFVGVPIETFRPYKKGKNGAFDEKEVEVVISL